MPGEKSPGLCFGPGPRLEPGRGNARRGISGPLLWARAKERQLKSAGELSRVSHPADFCLVRCSCVPTPVPECPPHTSTPAPIQASLAGT